MKTKAPTLHIQTPTETINIRRNTREKNTTVD